MPFDKGSGYRTEGGRSNGGPVKVYFGGSGIRLNSEILNSGEFSYPQRKPLRGSGAANDYGVVHQRTASYFGCGTCSIAQKGRSVSACWIPNRLSLDATWPRW